MSASTGTSRTLLGGLLIGAVAGNLLPGACEGLACLFTLIVLGYAGLILGVWVVVGTAVALARRRWPRSRWRLWALRGLAGASWLPVAWLIVLALD